MNQIVRLKSKKLMNFKSIQFENTTDLQDVTLLHQYALWKLICWTRPTGFF